nr:MAG TPA: resistance protein [Bacteriophage sp.]
MNLYELSSNYRVIQEMDLDEETLRDTLDSIIGEAEPKAENIVKWIRNLKGENTAIKEEETRLKNKRITNENKIKALSLYLEDFLKNSGLTRLKTGLFTLSIQNNPPSLEIYDSTLIPAKYLIEQLPTIDKQAIKELLKNCVEVPGAELKQTEGLRIR